MKSCFKNILVLFAVVFAFGSFQVEDASAQGPIIRKMRETFNKGRPLLPFVTDSKQDKPAGSSTKPTPATRPSPKKTPTLATRPSGSSTKSNNAMHQSGSSTKPSNAVQVVRSEGFGMVVQKSGESLVVSQVNPQGNAASAGVRRGDMLTGIGGAKLSAIEEFEGIAEAMSGGDRVEFDIARRGSKSQKVVVQFGKLEESDQGDTSAKHEVAPSAAKHRYEPAVGSGLESVYDGAKKPSSIMTPTPAPTPANRIESLEELDFPALDGGR